MPSPMTVMRRKTSKRPNSVVNNPQPTTPIRVTDTSKSGSVVTVTFDNPIILGSAVPQYTTTVSGATAVSATQTSPTTIEVTFSASIAAATAVNFPYEDPAVRNASGGFVSTSTFPVA